MAVTLHHKVHESLPPPPHPRQFSGSTTDDLDHDDHINTMTLVSNSQNNQFYKNDLDPMTLVLKKLHLDMVKMNQLTKN